VDIDINLQERKKEEEEEKEEVKKAKKSSPGIDGRSGYNLKFNNAAQSILNYAARYSPQRRNIVILMLLIAPSEL
jgi:hypothetical protein